ncbi:MAG: hypothetical protein M5U12_07845 [Verrucomicrobia bacterium]|nr:hypothetical protein [Verrucomicrobiota bacterium]
MNPRLPSVTLLACLVVVTGRGTTVTPEEMATARAWIRTHFPVPARAEPAEPGSDRPPR